MLWVTLDLKIEMIFNFDNHLNQVTFLYIYLFHFLFKVIVPIDPIRFTKYYWSNNFWVNSSFHFGQLISNLI